MINRDDLERLKEIRIEIRDLWNEAEGIILDSDSTAYDRAIASWISQIAGALGIFRWPSKDYRQFACSKVTMDDTIEELRDELLGAEENLKEINA